jgi:hypothetical protein
MNNIYKCHWIVGIVIVACVLFPFFLNWVLQKESFVAVVGDSVTWLSFWPVYLSAIASFGMIYMTFLSLRQNKKQLEELRRQREDDERARLVFSVVVYQYAFMLKISNIGKRNVYKATIHFNEDFLDELLEEKYQEGYRQLSKPFFVEAGKSRYLLIGWCQDINDAWKNKHVVIRMNGSYNSVYEVKEELDMNLFLDKTFMVVQGDLETTVGHIKKGLVVQNNSYWPVQKSLDAIAKSLAKVEYSLAELSENCKEQCVEKSDFDEKEDLPVEQDGDGHQIETDESE